MGIAQTVLVAGKGADGTPHVVEITVDGAVKVSASAADNPTYPLVRNLTLTLADTEYAQALPANCRAFEFHCRTANDIRFAFEPGRVGPPVAPYMTLPSGLWYYSEEVYLQPVWTLYFASAVAAVVVELIGWT